MKIAFILLSLVSLHAIKTSGAIQLKEENDQDSLAQVSTGAETETEMIPPSMITDVIKAIKGPPPAPAGPVDQYAPAINIVRSSRNLYAPANAFPMGAMAGMMGNSFGMNPA